MQVETLTEVPVEVSEMVLPELRRFVAIYLFRYEGRLSWIVSSPCQTAELAAAEARHTGMPEYVRVFQIPDKPDET